MGQITDIKLSRTLSEDEKKLFLLLLDNALAQPGQDEYSMPLESLFPDFAKPFDRAQDRVRGSAHGEPPSPRLWRPREQASLSAEALAKVDRTTTGRPGLTTFGDSHKNRIKNLMVSVRHRDGFFFILDSVRVSGGQLFYGLNHEYLAKRADPVYAKFFADNGFGLV